MNQASLSFLLVAHFGEEITQILSFALHTTTTLISLYYLPTFNTSLAITIHLHGPTNRSDFIITPTSTITIIITLRISTPPQKSLQFKPLPQFNERVAFFFITS